MSPILPSSRVCIHALGSKWIQNILFTVACWTDFSFFTLSEVALLHSFPSADTILLRRAID